jgi:hypothetical protein
MTSTSTTIFTRRPFSLSPSDELTIHAHLEKACCSLPPVQADYTPKGSYSDVNGLKSYIIGEESSKKVILVVYDIFGYSPQILQGECCSGGSSIVPRRSIRPLELPNFPRFR